MTPMETVLEKLPDAKRSGKGWKARCPAHDDGDPSLSIHAGDDGRALLKCHGGCSTAAVCNALGVSMNELFSAGDGVAPIRSGAARTARRSSATKPNAEGPAFATAAEAVAVLERRYGRSLAQWTYHEAGGNPVGVVVRWDRAEGGKEFRPVALIDDNWRLQGMAEPRPLLALPDVLKASTVFVCEGEKAAEAVRSLGLVATTSAHGAQSAAKTDWRPLAGKSVVILPDNDPPGRKFAGDVAGILDKLSPGPTVRIVELPALPEGGDAVEWVASFGGATEPATMRAELERLAQAAEVFNGGGSALTAAQPVLVRLSDVKPEPVCWLWPQRIALGKLTILVGDPGLGKSFLTCDLAARVTYGSPWPDDPHSRAPRGSVVMLNCEDDLADTIRPRLDRHGADVERIVALQAVRDASRADRQRPFNLARDLRALERAIELLGDCRLVIIDPVTAYLGDRHDSHKAADVRSLLAPLCELAARHRVAVLAVSHLNKGDGAAMYRTMGSLAFVAAARSVWCVSRDRENPERRLLLPIKNNLGNDRSGLAYAIVDGMVEWERDPVTVTADEALAPEAEANGRGELAEAVEWLRSYLKPGMPTPAAEILSAAREHGITEKLVRKAKHRLHVLCAKTAMRGGWTWTLPDDGDHRDHPERESSESS